MSDPCCIHYDGPPGHTHGTCCIEEGWQGGRGCELVTDAQRLDHFVFMAHLFGEAS